MPLVRMRGQFDVQFGAGQTPPPAARRYVGWRALHMAEGGRTIPYLMPAVVPPNNQIALEMTEAMQLMSFELMRRVNPSITAKVWRALHKWGLCLNNEPRDGFDGGIAHRDYVSRLDLDADTLPRYDKMQRTFQGTFIRGDAVGDRLVCKPGVHGIDARKLPYPTPTEIVERNWYVIAVNAGPSHAPQNASHFAQGKGGLVVYPFIFDAEISFPLAYFARWESDDLPDPVRMYL